MPSMVAATAGDQHEKRRQQFRNRQLHEHQQQHADRRPEKSNRLQPEVLADRHRASDRRRVVAGCS